MQLIDKTILAQSSKHLVLQQASAVTFADESCLQLNRVDIASGLTAPFLRAVYDGPDQVLVFDVRDVCRSLRESLKAAQYREWLDALQVGKCLVYPKAYQGSISLVASSHAKATGRKFSTAKINDTQSATWRDE